MFGKKDVCSICGNKGSGKNLSNGFICTDCTKRAGALQLFNWQELSMDQAGKTGFPLLPNWGQLSVEQVKKCIAEYEKMSQQYAIFSATQSVEKFFAIDETHRLWNLPGILFALSFDDIVRFELLQNGCTITQGGLCSAIAGGALFGNVGAVVGATVGKKKTLEEIDELKIRISTRNAMLSEVYVNFLKLSKVKSNSILYKTAYESAQRTLSLLTQITSGSQPEVNLESAADEIRKFKQLCDEGIITQEEFERKKEQLLK